jgi:hypothetical protein
MAATSSGGDGAEMDVDFVDHAAAQAGIAATRGEVECIADEVIAGEVVADDVVVGGLCR